MTTVAAHVPSFDVDTQPMLLLRHRGEVSRARFESERAEAKGDDDVATRRASDADALQQQVSVVLVGLWLGWWCMCVCTGAS